MLKLNGTTITDVKFNGTTLTKIIFNGVTVFQKIVENLAITLTNSYKNVTGSFHTYDANARLYTKIDTSLYKAIQFNVTESWITTNFASNTTYLKVVTYNQGGYTLEESDIVDSIEICKCQSNSSGVCTWTSQAGKWLTLNFSKTSGEVELYVIGTGVSTVSQITYDLREATLIAR